MAVVVTPSALDVLEPGEASLDEQAAIANREHHAVLESGVAMVDHAIAAGRALNDVQVRLSEGRAVRRSRSSSWKRWLKANFDASAQTALVYMTLADCEEAVRESGEDSIKGAMRYVRAALPDGGHRRWAASSDVREEALRLRRQGKSLREIGRLFDVSHNTVAGWVDPKQRAARRARAKRDYRRRLRERALAEERHAQSNAWKAARKVGGARSEAYAMAERMQDVLGQAHREATDREAREAWSRAGEHYRKMRDDIVRALGVS
jgi:transposase